MKKLLGCPFCGSHGKSQTFFDPYVVCTKCSATGPICEEIDAAINAWNDRATSVNKTEAEGETPSPAYALRGLYKLADEYFIDGKPCTPEEYISWQAGIIEAVTKTKLPEPKYYGGSIEEGDQHGVKCAYVDGWNDCRASILAAPQSDPSTEITALIAAAEHVVSADRACALDDSDINTLADAIAALAQRQGEGS